MSYNIDSWRTKEMIDFQISLKAIHANDELVMVLGPDNKVEITDTIEGLQIEGILDGDFVVVSKILYEGEGSGWAWDDFKELLSQSKGKLIASQVWEGGDSITKLIVIDGVMTEENVEV